MLELIRIFAKRIVVLSAIAAVPAHAVEVRPDSAPRVAVSPQSSVLRAPLRARTSLSLEDAQLIPTDRPSLGGSSVAQVIVAGEGLSDAFQELALWETRRGIPTVVRSLAWVEDNYSGFDSAARVRSFLRDAHDLWGTEFVVLGGDTDRLPARHVAWGSELILTDLYFSCLDREWNEDGDAFLGEPVSYAGFDNVVNDVAAGPDGSLWVATYSGVARVLAGNFTIYNFAQGLPSDVVYSVGVANDGSIWVGTEGGVGTLVGGQWVKYTIDQGLPTNRIFSVLPVSSTDVWTSSELGVSHFDGTSWTNYRAADGLPQDYVTSIAFDGSSLWAGTLFGVSRITDGVITNFSTANSGIRSDWVLGIGVAPSGDVYFGHVEDGMGRGGFSRYSGGVWSSETLESFGSLSMRDFSFGPQAGEWFAATDEGLFHRGPSGDELLDETSGLPTHGVSAVAVRNDGLVGVAQNAGMAIGGENQWTIYNTQNGLPKADILSDEIDLLPDLVLGRIPASSPAEVATYTQKLKAYQRGANAEGAGQALFIGEVLFATQDGKALCQSASQTFPSPTLRTELYESDGTLTAITAKARLEEGPGIVVHVSHGSYDVLGAGPGFELLFNRDLDDVDAGGRAGLYVVYSCSSGGFDQNCSMEHLLFNPNGGAVATVANTREAIATIDAAFNEAYFNEFFGAADGLPAAALRATHTNHFVASPEVYQSPTWARRMYLARNYLGSPTLSIFRGTPRTMSVSHPASCALARASFDVAVTDSTSGAPVVGARVCVSKGTEDYVWGFTDVSGHAGFQFRPESVGTVEVVVFAAEHLPYEGVCTVNPATAPCLTGAGWTSAPPAARVETPHGVRGSAVLGVQSLDLLFGLENVGTTATAPWQVILTSASPYVSVIQGAGNLSPMASGAIAFTSPLSIEIDADAPDGAVATLTLTGIGQVPFTETFSFPLESPSLELRGMETIGGKLVPRIANVGSSPATEIVATLAPVTADAVVIDGSTSTPQIHAKSHALVGDGFEVEGPPTARFLLTVQVQDRVPLVMEVDRDPPSAPSNVRASSTPNGARLEWDPSHSADVVGYRVDSRTGPSDWFPVTSEIVRDGSTYLAAFLPGHSREYLIRAIDTSGNASDESAVVLAHSGHVTMPGWPQALTSVVGPAAIVTADLDSDGKREVLLGSLWEANAVHVFQADGEEWSDGDLDPSTNGIFGKTQGRVNASPLTLDVDGDGLLEIFAPSYDGKVYGWRSSPTGGLPTPLPGWPINHGENGSRTSPVPADLDGDGQLEIVTVANDGKVRAFESNGSMVPGWPYVTRRTALGSTPAIADLNDDGLEDVVFGTTDSTCVALSGNGTPLPGWPVNLGEKVLSCPVLADIDGNGDFEIFVLDRAGKFWGFDHQDLDHDGAADPLVGWPVALAPLEISPPSPAVGDFDRDGSPEFVINGAENVIILKADGTHYGSSPIALGAQGVNSPLIVDLDGDGALDILVGLDNRTLVGLRPDGTILPRWPMEFLESPTATPSVADIDGDGFLDLAIGADDAVIRVVRLATPDLPGYAPWPSYHGGSDVRGVYIAPPNPTVDTPAPLAITSTRLELAPAWPNPFRQSTQVAYVLPSRSAVTLTIHDVTGRRVRTLESATPSDAGPHRTLWDAHDDAGQAVASGVYFVRLEAAGQMTSTRILRLH